MFFETPDVASDTWHMVGWLTLSHVSNGEISQTNERKSKGWPCVKPLEEGNPNVLDKRIR